MTDQTRDLYLDLLRRCLMNTIYDTQDEEVALPGGRFAATSTAALEGTRAWLAPGHTMIGLKRLANLQECLEEALNNQIPGDVIETGVWRGGATILMRGVLKAYGVTDRIVWVADSFQGVPPSNPEKYPADGTVSLSGIPELAVSLEQVKSNFERYGLLDDQVRFLKGWFKDTLSTAPIDRLAVLRLDGDLYESTTDTLTYLYPKVSPGGYVIVDDFGAIPACRQAVEDYLARHSLSVEIQWCDWTGVYWKKP